MRRATLVTLGWLFLGAVALAEQPKLQVMQAKDVRWQKARPAIPAGAEDAVLSGDPKKAEIYTQRVRVPDGWSIKPHTHPADEHLTVLSGRLLFGEGDRVDRTAMRELGPGAYVLVPAGTQHYTMAKGETILQFTNMGPWDINYVNPGDDPRQQRTNR